MAQIDLQNSSGIQPEGYGIELSRLLYETYAETLRQHLPEGVVRSMAVGLVGEGSECFGFDDEYSRDHDWGPAFCLWLPEQVLMPYQQEIEKVMAMLPSQMSGYQVRMAPDMRNGRVGPMSIESFYARFLRTPEVPVDWRQWRAIPEHHFAVCTNGVVFADALYESEPENMKSFSALRHGLLAYYPEDLRLKKLAARCAIMAQAGQYNLLRSLQRGEVVTSALCAVRFAEETLGAVHLLGRCFMPFYKWATQSALTCSQLGREIVPILQELLALNWAAGGEVHAKAERQVETICLAIIKELHAQSLSEETDGWLLAHAPQVQGRISTPELRNMPVMMA